MLDGLFWLRFEQYEYKHTKVFYGSRFDGRCEINKLCY